MILVTRATANVGGELVRQLAHVNESVRALVRGQERRVLPANVEMASGDLSAGIAVCGAEDVHGVFLLGPAAHVRTMGKGACERFPMMRQDRVGRCARNTNFDVRQD